MITSIKMQNDLYEAFPDLYRERDMTLQQSQMAWGIQCRGGWHSLLWDMSQSLTDLNQGITISEIRSCSGQLIVTATPLTEEARSIVMRAQEAAPYTCEHCGYSPAYLREAGAYMGTVACGRCVRDKTRRRPSKNRPKARKLPKIVVEKRKRG